MTATTQHPTVDKRVANTLNRAGFKVAELTEPQRVRALAAPDERPDLKGQKLIAWITEGRDASQEVADARAATRARRPAKAPGEGRRSKYSEQIRAAVKRSHELRGKTHGAGPKQHVHARDVITDEVGAPVTAEKVLAATGFGTRGELFDAAAGKGGRTSTKPLRGLAEKMGDDPWNKGRHLAAQAAAWIEELERGEQDGQPA